MTKRKPFGWVFLMVGSAVFAQHDSSDFNFLHFGSDQGLSQNTVTSMLQDRFGFLWVGTLSGLNRYWGDQFQVFRKEPNNQNSISDDTIFDLLESQDGQMWIGTRVGLCRWENRDTIYSTVHRYFHEPGNPRSLLSNMVTKVFQDRNGVIWAGTPKGLHRFNTDQDDFDRVQFSPNARLSLSGFSVLDMDEDRKGRLWVSTENGLTVFSTDRKSSHHLLSLPNELAEQYSIKTNAILDQITQREPLASTHPNSPESASKKTIEIETPRQVLVLGVGEKMNDTWVDVGEIFRNGKLYWSMESRTDRYAGGDERNRLVVDVLELPQGSYELVFQENQTHAPEQWVGLPPVQPSWWGLRIFTISSQEKDELSGRILEVEVFNPLPPGNINQLLVDSLGKMWATTLGAGTILFSEPPFETIQQKASPPQTFLFQPKAPFGKFPQDLIDVGGGNVWMTSERGLTRMTKHEAGRVNVTKNPHISDGLRTNELTRMVQGQDGVIWIGTILHGLAQWTPDGLGMKHVRFASEKPHLANKNVYAFSRATESTYWVGTRSGLSLFNLKKNRFVNLRGDRLQHPIFQSIITSLLTLDQKHTLVGSRAGLFFLKTEFGQEGQSQREVHIQDVFKVEFRQNTDGHTPQVTCIVPDPDLGIWVGTRNIGLHLFNRTDESVVYPSQLQVLSHIQNAIETKHVSAIFFDESKTMWIGTFGAGCIQIKRGKVGFHQYSPTAEGLNHAFVTCFLEGRDGTIWMGTYGGGINILSEDRSTWHYLTTADGLPDNVVYGLLEDDHGTIWASTNQGLARIIDRPDGLHIQQFDRASGLQSQEFHRGSFLKNKSGHLFFGGVNGFNIVSPNRPGGKQLSAPHISDIRILGEPMSFDQPMYTMNELVLGPNWNTFQLEFTPKDMSTRQSFAYRLVGLNDAWSTTNRSTSPLYSQLRPGSYLFQVKHETNPGGEIREIAIKVTPQFYETRLFRIFIILVVFGFVVGLYQWRSWYFRKQQSQHRQFTRDLIEGLEQERARIASGLHDGIGQELSSINSALQVQSEAAPPFISKSLVDLSTRVRSALTEIRTVSHNLRLHHLSELGLREALLNLTRKIEAASNIRTFLEWPEQDLSLTESQEVHLYRITQEALSNVLNHAEATIVRISLSCSSKCMDYEISDNGKGLEGAPEGLGGMGLRTMQERTRFLRGSFRLISKPGRGTLIKLKIPMTEVES